jgi:hypothetical protein
MEISDLKFRSRIQFKLKHRVFLIKSDNFLEILASAVPFEGVRDDIKSFQSDSKERPQMKSLAHFIFCFPGKV